jgi:hypothetical protein
VADERYAGNEVAALYASYTSVRSAKSRLEKQEKELREKLLLAAGYTTDDPKPPDASVQGYDGSPMYQVKVSYRKGLDTAYFKDKYPEIYAECEKVSPVKQIKAPE